MRHPFLFIGALALALLTVPTAHADTEDPSPRAASLREEPPALTMPAAPVAPQFPTAAATEATPPKARTALPAGISPVWGPQLRAFDRR